MAVIHIIEKVAITGTQVAPETLTYADYADNVGNQLGTFGEAPSVGIINRHQDRGANIVVDTIGVSTCQVAISDLGTVYDEYLFDLMIIGDS